MAGLYVVFKQPQTELIRSGVFDGHTGLSLAKEPPAVWTAGSFKDEMQILLGAKLHTEQPFPGYKIAQLVNIPEPEQPIALAAVAETCRWINKSILLSVLPRSGGLLKCAVLDCARCPLPIQQACPLFDNFKNRHPVPFNTGRLFDPIDLQKIS